MPVRVPAPALTSPVVTFPKPETRARVRALAESEWREPVVAVHLDDVKPDFDVPGRRKDGTVKGKRLVRRFFWNVFRGTVGGVVSAVLSIGSGTAAHVFGRSGRVSGPANAQALGLVDAARPANGPWLVYSPSHVAVVDSGHVFLDPADSPPPTILWHATGPEKPRIFPANRRVAWPDGSEFVYSISAEESHVQHESTANDEGKW
jgi:hypothetical protein